MGRAADCSIRLSGITVSRHHLLLEVQGETVRVTDLGSRNGAWINRERLRPNETRELKLHDHIYLPAEDLCLVRVGEDAELFAARPDPPASGSSPTGPNAGIELQPGGARRRFLAAMIDMAIFLGLTGLLAVPLVLEFPRLPATGSLLERLAAVAGNQPWIHVLIITAGVWIVLWMLYFVVGWGMLGATPGQAIMGLRVVDHRQRYPIGATRALLRLVAYSIGSLPLMAGHFLVIGRSDKRALHDMLAGTRVIRRPPRKPRGESSPVGPTREVQAVSSSEITGERPALPVEDENTSGSRSSEAS